MVFFRKFFRSDQGEPPDTGDDRASPNDDADQPEDREQPSALGVQESEPAETDTAAALADERAGAADAAPWWESGAPGQAAPDTDTPASAPADVPDLAAPSAAACLSAHERPTAPLKALAPEDTSGADDTIGADDQAADTPPDQPEATAPAMGGPLPEGTRQLSPQSEPELRPRRSIQGLAVAALRDVGRVRKVNQDSVFTLLTILPRESADLPAGLFVVADGMGGHTGGEIASRLAVRTVAHHVLATLVLPALDDQMAGALQTLMVDAVREANSVIWDQAQAAGTDMGTTCTAVLLLGHSLYIAHVGDSRAYLFEDGELRALTSDHSTVGRLIQLGQLDPSEAREHPLRNQLYRTVGQQPDVQVDFIYQHVGNGTHLLLCSDGLWGMIGEEHIRQALGHSLWPQDICEELIALANLAGGEDNISAVVVTLPVAERLP